MSRQVIEELQKQGLKIGEFVKYVKLSRSKFNHAVVRNDELYNLGLERKLVDFLEYKVEKLLDGVRRLKR